MPSNRNSNFVSVFQAETAISVGRSAGLITHSQTVFTILVKTHTEAARQLDLFGIAAQNGAALVIDGVSLQFCLDFHQQRFLGTFAALCV